MRVWIAEKPRVAEAIADAMGGGEKREGYWQAGENRISWALGHLLELARPEDYEKSWKRWKESDLPLLPDPLQTRPLPKHRKHLAILADLLEDTKTKEIINACDAGREGELIFLWILEQQKKAVQKKYSGRLWLSSLSPGAISRGIDDLQPAENFHSLGQAARARAEADWLLGINATRAATIALRGMGTVSLGRVQTPTLALIVRRDEARDSFSPETFWTVRADFKSSGGKYSGEHKSGRMEKAQAKRIEGALGKKGKIIALQEKAKKEKPPLLYDLTSLQREASSRWGWPASKTLRTAQALYEEKKVLSYPRTDSRFLPEDTDIDSLRKMVPQHTLRKELGRVLRDSGVTDHHALVPIARAKGLSGDQKKLYDMVCLRVAEVFSPDASFLQQTVQTKSGEEVFITRGKRYTDWGWRELAGAESLPHLREGEEVAIQNIRAEQGKTKPPPRYSDGTLLGAMETAGSEIDDEDAREAMKERGLGTPATRAAIIERLLDVGYIEREGKALLATDKGRQVVQALEGSELLSAQITGEWERDLRVIESGEGADIFRKRLREWVTGETERLLELDPEERSWGKCPECGKRLYENRSAISCWTRDDPGCGFALWKKVAGKNIPEKALRELLQSGRAGTVRGFRSRAGKKFSAKLALQNGKVVFDEDWAR